MDVWYLTPVHEAEPDNEGVEKKTVAFPRRLLHPPLLFFPFLHLQKTVPSPPPSPLRAIRVWHLRPTATILPGGTEEVECPPAKERGSGE